MRKYKGIVRERTMNKILNHPKDFFSDSITDIVRVIYLPGNCGVFYQTTKSNFVAVRKNVKYWSVWQIFGDL